MMKNRKLYLHNLHTLVCPTEQASIQGMCFYSAKNRTSDDATDDLIAVVGDRDANDSRRPVHDQQDLLRHHREVR